MKHLFAALLFPFLLAVGAAAASPARLQAEAQKETSAASAPQRATPITTGDQAPDFTLVAQNGEQVTLSKVMGDAPTVLVFYRGYW